MIKKLFLAPSAAVALRLAIGLSFGSTALASDLATTDSATADLSSAAIAIDADMQAVLTELQALGGKPIETLTPREARLQPTPKDAVNRVLVKRFGRATPEPVALVRDIQIQGTQGRIPARVYWPSAEGTFPVTVYFHGGGWVIGSRDVYDASARSLTNLAQTIVISVDYRVGPEHRFPAAHDDAYASYLWALKNAATLHGDANRIALAGESAGGNLAIATAITARDQHVKPPLAILSVYPIAGIDLNTPSYLENKDAKPLNRAMMHWFFQNYLNNFSDAHDPRIDLVHADLKGLPPTILITDQIDPLRSEGLELATRLKASGVSVTSRDYTGVTHEFFSMGAVVAKAKAANRFAASELKSLFGK